MKYIIFRSSSSKYNEVSHNHLYLVRGLPVHGNISLDQHSSGYRYINTPAATKKLTHPSGILEPQGSVPKALTLLEAPQLMECRCDPNYFWSRLDYIAWTTYMFGPLSTPSSYLHMKTSSLWDDDRQPAPTADQLQHNPAIVPAQPSYQHQLQTSFSLTQQLFLHDQVTVFVASSQRATRCLDKHQHFKATSTPPG